MLETLRAFGRTRLATDPGARDLRARHATWAARLADEITADHRGPGETAAVRRFDAHLADLRRAHSWHCDNGPTDELLRLTVPIAELSYLRSRVDLVLLLEETLRRTGNGPAHPLAARLLGYHAHTLWQRGDLDGASRLGRHRDAAMLLGALAAGPRATHVYGADSERVDAVARAARAALGSAFEPLRSDGAALGDVGALALARRLTRTDGEAPGSG
jgi:hypothetical protein